MKTYNNLCFIAAKGTSTRLAFKNIRKLNGKELIYYPIQSALDSKLFKKKNVIISTDSKKIKSIAQKYGANVPYLRDEKLSNDPYGVSDVALDFFNRFPNYITEFDHIFFLFPTCPLANKNDITAAYKIFLNNNFEFLMSVTETHHNAYRSSVINNSELMPLFENSIRERSQALARTYRINGAIVICKIDSFLKEKTYFGNKIGVYTMPKERSVDIDSEFDFKFAEFLINNRDSINEKNNIS